MVVGWRRREEEEEEEEEEEVDTSNPNPCSCKQANPLTHPPSHPGPDHGHLLIHKDGVRRRVIR